MSKPSRCSYFNGITDLNALTRACEFFARDIFDRLLVGHLEGDNLSDSLLKADGGLAWSRLPNEPKRLQAPLLSTKKAPAVREKDGAGIEIVVNADDSTSGRVCVVDKDNLATQIISLIPDDPEDGTSGGAVDFPAGIGVLRTSGNFNLRLSRNSILMLELTSTHIEASDDLLPSSDSTLDVGSDTTRWRYVYGDRAYVGDGAAGNQIFLDVRNAAGRVQLQVNATTDRTITFQDLGYTVENTGHASKHQNDGGDEVATATPGANAIPKAGAGGTLATGWLPAATTSAQGAVELATDGEDAASVVAQGNDSRLAPAIIGGNFGGNQVPAFDTRYLLSTTITTATGNAEFIAPRAGLIRNLYVRTLSAQPADGVLTVSVLNISGGSVVIEIPASGAAATRSNTADTAAVAAGERVVLELVNYASSAGAQVSAIGYEIAQ